MHTRTLIEAACLAVFASSAPAQSPIIERVTTVIPFPRGLAERDGEMYVLARGRVRDYGGVSASLNDRAGTIYVIDASIGEPLTDADPSSRIATNGRVFAEPTDPPFHLWDRSADPPESDSLTDRPYCTLRWHEPTKSFYICAFSGVDLYSGHPIGTFSKNLTDAVMRYDTRTNKWYDIERHRAGTWDYPHHDPERNDPPHGWLKGPDNALPLGNWLYAVAKDNSVLVRYDLTPLETDPEAGAPDAELLMTADLEVEGLGARNYQGQSGLAYRDGWLVISYRTTGEVIRIPLDENNNPVRPIRAQLIGQFDPWERAPNTSADITDIDFDDQGRLYILCAQPARIYRFEPNPAEVFDGRRGASPPWVHLAEATDNLSMKSENIMLRGDWLYVTSGDGYAYQNDEFGTVYRVKVD